MSGYQAARCRAGGIRMHTENSLQRTLSHQQDPNPLTTICTMFLSKIPISARSLPIAGLRFCQVRTTLEIELAMDYVRSRAVRSLRWPTTRTGSTQPASIATQENTYKGPACQAPGLASSQTCNSREPHHHMRSLAGQLIAGTPGVDSSSNIPILAPRSIPTSIQLSSG